MKLSMILAGLLVVPLVGGFTTSPSSEGVESEFMECEFCDCMDAGPYYVCACYEDPPGWEMANCQGYIGSCDGTPEPCTIAFVQTMLQPIVQILAARPNLRSDLDAVIAENSKYLQWNADRSAVQLLDCQTQPFHSIEISAH
jgi:hypothetical protein